MPEKDVHTRLAEKLMFKKQFPGNLVGEAVKSLVRFAFTEEEAAVMCGLSVAPLPARAVAARARMPVSRVRPVLASLADRYFIFSMSRAGITVYNLLPLAPGIFEFQMIASKKRGADVAWFTEFARLFEDVYDEYATWARPKAKGKDLRLGRIVPVEQSVDTAVGIMPLATDRFSEIVDRTKKFALADVCSCRREKELLGEGCGRGMHACSGLGLLADVVISKGLGRQVSREEFVDAKMRAVDQGLVHMVDNLHSPMQVCSCCTCCCGALRLLAEYNIPTIIAKSHFEAVVDEDRCIGCGQCVDACPMGALAVEDGACVINYVRCIGCGLCVGACDKQKALGLRERLGHRPPEENVAALFYAAVRAAKGDDNGGWPMLSGLWRR